MSPFFSLFLLQNVNKLQDIEACLHIDSVSKSPLIQVGAHYKSNQVAYIIRMTVASQYVFQAEN